MIRRRCPTPGLSMSTVNQQLKSTLKKALGPLYPMLRKALLQTAFYLRPRQSEDRLRQDAQHYWNDEQAILPQMSHWSGAGDYSDEERWTALGAEHLALYEDFARMTGKSAPLKRVIEWGCGGGANAIHFAPVAEEFVGIDVAEATLKECERVTSSRGLTNFRPKLISVTDPDEARTLASDPCDLFLCTYVFELLPTPEYGLKVLSIAHDLLEQKGMAIIQIRYISDSWETKPKRFGYRNFIGSNTTYRIDDFWKAAEQRGFEPKAVKLVPYQSLNENTNYAYFMLVKN